MNRDSIPLRLAVVCVLVLVPGMGAVGDDPNAPAPAGREADRLVARALEHEARGDRAERDRLLNEAIRIAPDHPAARGLLGQVRQDGRWLEPDEVARLRRADPARQATWSEFQARRDRLTRLADEERQELDRIEAAGPRNKALEVKLRLDRKRASEHAQLGLWCEQQGLADQARAHFRMAAELEPERDTNWRKLGYVKQGRTWLSPDQQAAIRQQEADARRAEAKWEPLLRRWAEDRAIATRRDEAEARLAEVRDPEAVPAIVRLFARGPASVQPLAVQLLLPIRDAESTRALAYLAVFGATAEVRNDATRALDGRDPIDYAGELVGLIRTPCQYEYRPVAGPGSRGSLEVDTPRFHLSRSYLAFAMRVEDYLSSGGYVGPDLNGVPVAMDGWWSKWTLFDLRHHRWGDLQQQLRIVEAYTSRVAADFQIQNAQVRARLAADVLALEQYNAESRALNERVIAVLRTTLKAPESLGEDEDAWRAWYDDRLGYHYVPPPKINVFGNQTPHPLPPRLIHCFVAGTPVLTIDGPRPIESIGVGDEVLGQDVETGALAFRTVQLVRPNPPDRVLTIRLENGESVHGSPLHRFWQAGRGWRLARELQAGDGLRARGGRVRIAGTEAATGRPTYSLTVEGGTYFVGSSAVLVHDETLPEPHPKRGPFDALPEPKTEPPPGAS